MKRVLLCIVLLVTVSVWIFPIDSAALHVQADRQHSNEQSLLANTEDSLPLSPARHLSNMCFGKVRKT